MIHDLKPYPAYKDSGVPWLGEVPEHWEVVRCGRLFREIVDTGHPDAELLSIDRVRGIIRQSETGRKERASEDRSSYKRVLPGELAYNLMNAFMGSIGISTLEGIISPAYAVARPLREIEPAYYHYLFRTQLFTTQFDRYSYGIMYERNRLYFERFKMIPTIVPSITEQSAIVHYLDYIDRRIRRYIRAKQKLLKLLEEQKQAIIHQAVTRGLDPNNVKLKPSGMKWLGDVPEHWEIRPLKYWVHINRKTLPETTDEDYTFSYIDIGSVTTGRIVRPLEKISFGKAPSRARRIVSKGDTIISTVRTYLKAVLYISEESGSLIASTGFAVLSPKEDVFPEYLGYMIQSDTFIDQVTANSIGVAYPAISESSLGRFEVSLPPSIIEQEQIAFFVKKETAFLEKAISSAYQEISLLREYRTRLIVDVVTGKLDVRKAAANLSDKSDEMEVEDDFEEETTEEIIEEVVTEEIVEGEA